jgi:hypothetical protein
MTRSATAVAHPNIALAKYWGKRAGEGNIPAVPSLSVTLAGMSTTTTVSFDATLVDDELVLNGVSQAPDARTKVRATQLLDRVRAGAQLRRAQVRELACCVERARSLRNRGGRVLQHEQRRLVQLKVGLVLVHEQPARCRKMLPQRHLASLVGEEEVRDLVAAFRVGARKAHWCRNDRFQLPAHRRQDAPHIDNLCA